MFNKYLVYNKYKVNFNFNYLLRNRLLILICEILKCKKILLARRCLKKIISKQKKYSIYLTQLQ